MSGKLVISIDFELRWGVHDVYGLNFDAYRKNLENARAAVNKTLEMFENRNIRSTWATVGAIGLDNWNDYFNIVHSQPKYKNQKFNIIEEYSKIDPNGDLHFAPNLVQKIIETQGQELGSHTFSHIYCREDGFDITDFLYDTNCYAKVFKEKFNILPRSIVFPRNQTNFIELLKDLNFEIYREKKAYIFNNKIAERAENVFEVISPFPYSSVKFDISKTIGNLFIRFDLPSLLWKIQMNKLKYTIQNMSNNDVFHIWWHPHNVGPNLKFGLARFEEMFDLIAEEINANRVTSLNMLDLVSSDSTQ